MWEDPSQERGWQKELWLRGKYFSSNESLPKFGYDFAQQPFDAMSHVMQRNGLEILLS